MLGFSFTARRAGLAVARRKPPTENSPPVRTYELVVIYGVEQVPELTAAHIDAVTERISAHGGEVDTANTWGRRKFAYPIKKQREGHYVLLKFTIDPANIGELEGSLRLVEDVTRFLIVAEDPEVAAYEAKQLAELHR